MKRYVPVLLLVLTLLSTAAAESARSFYNKGRDAEARQDWDRAYESYKNAAELKPKDIRYRTALTRTRFQAASQHVHRGQLLRDNGNLEPALAEFMRAAQIDPSLAIAQQEIRRTRVMIQKAGAAKPQAAAPPASE